MIRQLTFSGQAVTDFSCVLFSDELVAAHPNAKMVLTNRDVEQWLASMEQIYTFRGSRLATLLHRVQAVIMLTVRSGVVLYTLQEICHPPFSAKEA